MTLLVMHGLVSLGFLALQTTAIRNQADITLSDSSEYTTCKDKMLMLVTKNSYQRLYRPILDGTYRIRNRNTGKYLTAGPQGVLGTSRHHVDSSKASDWKVKRVLVQGTPMYSLENRNSGSFLSVEKNGNEPVGVLRMASQGTNWQFELNKDGIYFSLDSENTEIIVFEDVSGFLEIRGRPDIPEGSETKGDWELEMMLGFLRWPRSDLAEYARQWTVAGNIPVWHGGSYTFLQMCADVGAKETCPSGYASSRARHVLQGRISETSRRVVTESLVTGCDSQVSLSRIQWTMPRLLAEVQEDAGAPCAGLDTPRVSATIKQAIEETCYQSCIADLTRTWIVGDGWSLGCHVQSPESWGKFFKKVLESKTDNCNHLPSDTLMSVADFVMQKHCWKWKVPSLLWLANDKGPGLSNMARADGHAVCSMKPGKETSRSEDDIDQNGTCVEGMTCNCPGTWLSTHDSTSKLRLDSGQLKVLTGNPAASTFFTPDHSVGLGGLVRNTIRFGATSTAANLLIRGMSVSGALLAAPFGVPFIIQESMSLVAFTQGAMGWTCGKVVGCWPQWPHRVSTPEQSKACRLPRAAEAGGSEVWFMPPPGFMLQHHTWAIRKCVLSACTRPDMIRQRVGFGEAKQNVYNCQPLSWEVMDVDQKTKYKNELRKTIASEYNAGF